MKQKRDKSIGKRGKLSKEKDKRKDNGNRSDRDINKDSK